MIFDIDAIMVTDTSSGGVRASTSTVPLLRRLQSVGIATAVSSSTRNCAHVLRKAGIAQLVSVTTGEAPTGATRDPARLIEVATRLGVRPGRCVVIAADQPEVHTASDHGFSLVIGLDKTGHADELLSCGADNVIANLAEILVRSGGAALSTIPDALQAFSQIKGLMMTRRPAVFVDFDGTLSEIVARPQQAALVEGAADALRALVTQCPVAVISGRDLADVRDRVKVDGLWFAGNHGFELLAPDGSHYQKPTAEEVSNLALAAARLVQTLSDIPGIAVEHKRFAVAVHYRNADPKCVDRVIETVRRLGRVEGLRVATGRQVIELRPNIHWDKGSAIQWIRELTIGNDGGTTHSDTLPLYIGDDLTDEDAFDAVRRGGVGIVVRHDENIDRPSAASFRLENPSSVAEFIRQLADSLQDAAASPKDAWELVYDGYDPQDERLREALCTVGNGYVATRGCAPEASACDVHYPGTYAAGVYNMLADHITGQTIENESLVNLPNWLSLTFRIDDGPWFSVDGSDLLAYRQTFDLRDATLTRSVRFRDSVGRITTLVQQRFASMHDPHLAAMQTRIKAENWSGTVEFKSLLDATIANTLVDRYRDLSSIHLSTSVIEEIPPDSVVLTTQTSQSHIVIALAARSTVWHGDAPADAKYAVVRAPGRGGHNIQIALSLGQSVTLEKVVTIFTSRDTTISEPASAARHYLEEAGQYADLRRLHSRAWAWLWDRCDVGMADNIAALRILRLHLVHLLQTISPHTAELDAGVPARGLHGEAYRGHVFWDALFISPVLSLRLPNVARSLLHYRYRRLREARNAARRAGYLGAMYPWQSGSDGREVSQELHLNPQSGRWNPDPSARAHHVGLAVAYNAWQHYQATGDRQFLVDHGAEMLVEIARFWASLASFDVGRDRYSIRRIIGPDEFHSGYPGNEYDGIDNNAYTNVMAVWVILRAIDALDLLPLRDRLELIEKVGLTTQERNRWDDVSRRMFVPFHDGVISQFEGYSELAELDWEHYLRRYANIRRLDRILEAEGDNVNNYKASKQADALMLLYLLSSDELLGVLGRLGYHFAPEQIPKTVDYYMARTSHGSTLSAVVHSWVLARANRHNAMEYFEQVLCSDIADIQGGTTAEGIHLAAMAGSIDLLQRCFTGLETRDDRLVLGPHWPQELGPIEFPFVYRGHRLHLRISGRSAALTAEASNAAPIDVECRGRVRRLQPGHVIEV
ncbi:trehalose-phosphatase [Mycobacterium riyadhense]|uniref:trehalose-phosphatase n=1 Tax=Mycobacterium riyadhense TaxID=486698 RepID=UPI003B849D2D